MQMACRAPLTSFITNPQPNLEPYSAMYFLLLTPPSDRWGVWRTSIAYKLTQHRRAIAPQEYATILSQTWSHHLHWQRAKDLTHEEINRR